MPSTGMKWSKRSSAKARECCTYALLPDAVRVQRSDAPRTRIDPARSNQLLVEAGYQMALTWTSTSFASASRRGDDRLSARVEIRANCGSCNTQQYAMRCARATHRSRFRAGVHFSINECRRSRRCSSNSRQTMSLAMARSASSGARQLVGRSECAAEGLRQSSGADSGACLRAAPLLAADVLRRCKGPGIYRLSGRDAPVLGNAWK